MINGSKLRIGRIPYANLFPIFYTLEKEFDCSSYEFVEGAPSRLNRMLREGDIDISPSSSIEYLRNPSLYRIVEGHSISSRGAVGSIFLFSERPIEKLDGAVIAVTSQSETSVALLSIILEKFHEVRSILKVHDKPEDAGHEAFLLIGDDALTYEKAQRARGIGQEAGRLVYDLGEMWFNHTGLPFVFALWIVRPDVGEKALLLDRFLGDLDKAKTSALRRLDEIARHSPMREYLTENEIRSYWDKLDYELTEEHKKGLALFGKYIKELMTVNRNPNHESRITS